ncbi:MAG: hypothetical protein ACOH1R_06830 [Luteimonas sp.]
MSQIPSYHFSYVGEVQNEREIKSSSAAKGSWLVALATMLGKMADRLGDGIVKQADRIDQQMNKEAKFRNNNEGKGVENSNLTQLNAEMQAMAQQMKMLMDAISTIIKTIGEGNSGLARKQ